MKKWFLKFYKTLFDFFGYRNWWPGETIHEIIIGAILTQSTAWINVEKAIKNLRQNNLLCINKLKGCDENMLASLIKPTGYYNQKAKKLKKISEFFSDYSFDKFKALPLEKARELLLSVWGIGEETADSILLYAFEKPIFVIDAYTKRIFSRHGVCKENIKYAKLQKIITDNIPKDTDLYNDFHAQLVELGKNFCLKSNPKCDKCPVRDFKI